MANKPKHSTGININSNGPIRISGDIVGRDKITHNSSSNQVYLEQILNQWGEIMNNEVDNKLLPSDKKSDIKNQITAIKSAIVQDKGKNLNRLEKLINTVAKMSPDIFDVVIATLVNPLAGIGLTIHKISDKVKLESQPQ